MFQAIGAVTANALHLVAAAFDECPLVMLVGMSPLSLIAAETAWHLIGELIEGAAFLPPQLLKLADVAGGIDRGRIWRIVPTDFNRPKPPQLGKATTAELGPAIQSAAQEAPRAVDSGRYSRDARDSVKEYFQNLGDQK